MKQPLWMVSGLQRQCRWMARLAALSATLGMVLAAGPGAAFQPLIADDTGTQGAGGNQLEGGWSNPAPGAKWRFYDDDRSKLSFALRPELQLPASRGKEARGLGQANKGNSPWTPAS